MDGKRRQQETAHRKLLFDQFGTDVGIVAASLDPVVTLNTETLSDYQARVEQIAAQVIFYFDAEDAAGETDLDLFEMRAVVPYDIHRLEYAVNLSKTNGIDGDRYELSITPTALDGQEFDLGDKDTWSFSATFIRGPISSKGEERNVRLESIDPLVRNGVRIGHDERSKKHGEFQHALFLREKLVILAHVLPAVDILLEESEIERIERALTAIYRFLVKYDTKEQGRPEHISPDQHWVVRSEDGLTVGTIVAAKKKFHNDEYELTLRLSLLHGKELSLLERNRYTFQILVRKRKRQLADGEVGQQRGLLFNSILEVEGFTAARPHERQIIPECVQRLLADLIPSAQRVDLAGDLLRHNTGTFEWVNASGDMYAEAGAYALDLEMVQPDLYYFGDLARNVDFLLRSIEAKGSLENWDKLCQRYDRLEAVCYRLAKELSSLKQMQQIYIANMYPLFGSGRELPIQRLQYVLGALLVPGNAVRADIQRYINNLLKPSGESEQAASPTNGRSSQPAKVINACVDYLQAVVRGAKLEDLPNVRIRKPSAKRLERMREDRLGRPIVIETIELLPYDQAFDERHIEYFAINRRPFAVRRRRHALWRFHPGDILVAPRAIGWCGSEGLYAKALKGEKALYRMPIVLGHEVSVIVVLVGPEAEYENGQQVQVNDMAAIVPFHYCQTCWNCRQGRENFCTNAAYAGSTASGAYEFPEFNAVGDRERLLHLEINMPHEQVALIEPMSICLRAVLEMEEDLKKWRKGDHIVVWGTGIMAYCVLGALLARRNRYGFQPEDIVMIGRSEEKLIPAVRQLVTVINLKEREGVLLDRKPPEDDIKRLKIGDLNNVVVAFECVGGSGAAERIWQLGQRYCKRQSPQEKQRDEPSASIGVLGLDESDVIDTGHWPGNLEIQGDPRVTRRFGAGNPPSVAEVVNHGLRFGFKFPSDDPGRTKVNIVGLSRSRREDWVEAAFILDEDWMKEMLINSGLVRTGSVTCPEDLMTVWREAILGEFRSPDGSNHRPVRTVVKLAWPPIDKESLAVLSEDLWSHVGQ